MCIRDRVLAESLCRMGAQIVLSPCAWAVPPDCTRAYYGAEWYGCLLYTSRCV